MASGGSALYRRADVLMHAKASDCWVIIDNKVYNITRFLTSHPGGSEILMDYAGKDASGAFDDVGHSSTARMQLAAYCIGALVVADRIG